MEKVKQVFKKYPNQKELYITSDGNVFLEKMWAESHANGLYDKKILKEGRPTEEFSELEESEEIEEVEETEESNEEFEVADGDNEIEED